MKTGSAPIVLLLLPDASLSLIGSLLFSGSPAAILRRVIPVVVDAVKRQMFCWPSAHVCQEVFEGMPATADANAAASVVLEEFMVRILTALHHVDPCDVLGCLSARGVAVFLHPMVPRLARPPLDPGLAERE